MTGGSEPVRRAARAAAFTLFKQLENEDIQEPVLFREEDPDGKLEICIVVAPKDREQVSLPALVPAVESQPFHTFFPGVGLAPVERDLIDVFQSNGNRRLTTADLLIELTEHTESLLKQHLSRLTKESVGMLDNTKSGPTPGYHLTPLYIQYLAWCADLRQSWQTLPRPAC